MTPDSRNLNRHPLATPTPKTSNRGSKQGYNQKPFNRFNSRTRNIKRPTNFEGSEPKLGSHTYTLGYTQHEAFNRTTKEISDFVGRTYRNGGDMKRTIDAMTKINIPPPADLPENPEPTATEKRI